LILRTICYLRTEGIRISALCPYYAETNIVYDYKEFKRAAEESPFGIIAVSKVVEGFKAILENTRDNGNLQLFGYYVLTNL